MNNHKSFLRSMLPGHACCCVPVFAFLFFTFNAQSQNTAGTDIDIFVVPLTPTADGFTLGAGRMVTKAKRYENDPSFSYDSQYMYHAAEGDDSKTDIHAVYLPQFQSLEFIGTGTVSEHCPLQKPDMKGLALVQESADGKRHVLFYPSDGGATRNLTPNQENVESYAWLSDTSLALRLTDGTLGWLDFNRARFDTLVTNVGKSIGKVPSEDAVYFTRTENGLEHLYRFDYGKRKMDTLMYLPGGASEFTVAIDGSLWCANKGVVYRYKRAGAGWDMMHDFGTGALGGAFRLAVSRDLKWLAVVTEYRLD